MCKEQPPLKLKKKVKKTSFLRKTSDLPDPIYCMPETRYHCGKSARAGTLGAFHW